MVTLLFRQNPSVHGRLRHQTQEAAAPAAVRFVSGIAPVPSALMIQMLTVPLELAASVPSSARLESNKIWVLFADQITGAKPFARLAVSLVTAIGLELSAFMTRIFSVLFGEIVSLPFKERLDSKAIFVPSGEYVGRTAVDRHTVQGGKV